MEGGGWTRPPGFPANLSLPISPYGSPQPRGGSAISWPHSLPRAQQTVSQAPPAACPAHRSRWSRCASPSLANARALHVSPSPRRVRSPSARALPLRASSAAPPPTPPAEGALRGPAPPPTRRSAHVRLSCAPLRHPPRAARSSAAHRLRGPPRRRRGSPPPPPTRPLRGRLASLARALSARSRNGSA
jgi:hypothetical protein